MNASHSNPPAPSCITRVAGVEVGHYTDARRPTGCSVILTRAGAVGGVDVRGAAPGTRETDLLDPVNTVDTVHAVLLSGGSAFGLDAATGVMRWLEERDIGVDVGGPRVPIVPAAVLFDLHVATDTAHARIRPDAAAGYAACEAASAKLCEQGNVGAGTGAIVGKIFGMAHAMKGGIGSASVTVGGVTVGALIAVNALGDVIDPATGQIVAGARTPDGQYLRDTQRTLLGGAPTQSLLKSANTTIGCIATDAKLTKAECKRLAMAGHDGLARAIRPAHTVFDGDTLFALATGLATAPSPGLLVLSAMGAEAVALATLNAVRAARGLRVGEQHWPAAQDVAKSAV